MFEKAYNKVREAEIFLKHLQGESLSDDYVAAYWSAFLNAGYSVVQALTREVPYLIKPISAKPPYERAFSAWHRGLAQEEAELFDVLQAVRDVEVHAKDRSTTFLTKTEERTRPRGIPEDSTYHAAYSNYMVMGMISHEVTFEVRTYDFIVTGTDSRDRNVQALVEGFKRGGERAVLDAASRYARLLASLVDGFLKIYS